MSVLTLLCFTSLLYFSLADPVPPTEDGTAVPSNAQAQLESIFEAFNHVLDTHLPPLISRMDEANQQFIRAQCTRIARGCLNFMMSWVDGEINSNSASVDDGAYIMHFDSPNWPSIAGKEENECV